MSGRSVPGPPGVPQKEQVLPSRVIAIAVTSRCRSRRCYPPAHACVPHSVEPGISGISGISGRSRLSIGLPHFSVR